MLSETQVRNAKPSDRPRKIFDHRGLYLQVTPNGRRYWRFDYVFNDKRKTLTPAKRGLEAMKPAEQSGEAQQPATPRHVAMN
jgi:hypothetical protein